MPDRFLNECYSRNNLPNSKPGHGVPRLSGGKPGGKGSPSRPQGTPGVVKVSFAWNVSITKQVSLENILIVSSKLIWKSNISLSSESSPKEITIHSFLSYTIGQYCLFKSVTF